MNALRPKPEVERPNNPKTQCIGTWTIETQTTHYGTNRLNQTKPLSRLGFNNHSMGFSKMFFCLFGLMVIYWSADANKVKKWVFNRAFIFFLHYTMYFHFLR